MYASTFTFPRFALAVLTLLALAIKPYFPPKILVVHPGPRAVASIYAPPGAVYGDDYAWIEVGGDKWRCHFDQRFGSLTYGWSLGWKAVDDDRCLSGGGYPKCSMAAFDDDRDGWGRENGRACVVVHPEGGPSPEHPQSRKATPFPAPIATHCSAGVLTGESAPPTMDFSGYEGLNIHVHYEGRAEFLRLYMRNFNPVYTDPADINTSKFMSALLRTDDLRAGPLYVRLAEFSVEEWWVMQTLKQNADRQLAMPEFDRIVSLGIDHVEYGVHKMQVKSVELVGQRMPTPVYLAIILLVWVVFLCLELIVRFYRRAKFAGRQTTASAGKQDVPALADRADIGPRLRKTPAITDVLTGAYNRAGIEQQIGAWYGATTFPPAFAVIILDVDQFSQFRDKSGGLAADQLLHSFSAFVETNTREQDILARWDDAVFVLLSRQVSKVSLIKMAEKLRQKIAGRYFEPAGKLTITVSMGITMVCPGDTFHMALKRAEIALHKARGGGNCVVYEE